MNIRTRIILLMILTFISIFLIGGYAIFQAKHNSTDVRSVTEGVVPSALASSDLVSQLKDVQIATMTMVSAPDNNVALVAKTDLSAKKLLLKSGLELQAKFATDKTQQGLIEQAGESLGNYFSSIDDTATLKLAGQTTLAEATLFAGVAAYQHELEVIVETLRIEKNRSKDTAIAALNESLSATATGISLVTVVIVLVLSAFGVLLYRRIITPIGKMKDAMSHIAASQDFSHQVPVERMDEIGQSIVAFNVMIAKTQESSGLLRQKTTDMQSMLQNMPQGILTVVNGSKIHPEYSAYLETIFETNDIAGRDMMELVFSNTTLGADILSQVDAATAACVGQDVMNFDFNQHLMVGEIEKLMPDGRFKILDLNWSPISDDSGTTVRLMLCVRDVTELRKLAAEANKQKRELEIIGEILGVSQDKFHEFINSAMQFIDDNEALILDSHVLKPEVVTQLFRNMHTITGNARTYALNHLAGIVHEAEQSYSELRKPRPTMAWDQATLLAELDSVKAVIEHYKKVSEVSLGRKSTGRHGGPERYLMVDRHQIQETLHRLESVNTGNLHELVAARNAVSKTLHLLGTERIVSVLEGVFDSLPALASDLGKVPPMVDITDNGYVVHNQVGGLLKNVFMHLIRNAMDHGIESPDVRLAANKPVAGTICLTMDAADDMLQISLSDDGRGLALARIRAIAADKGLISADAQLGDEEIANLIFRAGFSTVETVTEVSGRGVGMDAVVAFLKRENGTIGIRFTDNEVGAAFRQFETVIHLPQSLSEHADGFDIDSKDEADDIPLQLGSGIDHVHGVDRKQA